MLDINALEELRGFSETPTHLVIGARTSWTDVVKQKLPPAFDALKQAAKEVGSVQIQIEHFASERSVWGFYGYLPFHAQSHQEVPPRAPGDPDLGPPECASNRVKVGEETWKITTCAVAFKAAPELFDIDLVATSLTRSKEAMFLSLGFKGFRMKSALDLSKRLIENVSWGTR